MAKKGRHKVPTFVLELCHPPTCGVASIHFPSNSQFLLAQYQLVAKNFQNTSHKFAPFENIRIA
jgi:hypothetical protein